MKCRTKEGDKNIENLFNIFSSDIFKIRVLDFKKGSKNKIYKSLSFSNEGPYIDNMLENPTYLYTQYPCLLIKDSSICFFNSTAMKNIIKFALENRNGTDMIYLSKWGDQCYNHKSLSTGNIFGSHIKITKTPYGSQCILFFPESRDKMLNFLKNTTASFDDIVLKCIRENQIKAAVFHPSIIKFDSELATSFSDFKKFNECSIKTNQQNDVNSITFLWFIVIFFLIVLVFWALVQIEPNN